MSIERDPGDGAASAAALLARAATAAQRADRRLLNSIDDLFLPDDARLTERERTALSATLAAIIGTIEDDLRRQLARTLPQGVLAAADRPAVLDRLIASGALRDAALMHELIARVRLEILGELLPSAAPDEPDTPALLSRLVASNDIGVAHAARALMTATARRRDLFGGGRTRDSELPAELHHQLVWWVAAAIRRAVADPSFDRALGEAALHNLANHDEGDRVEGVAMRLAAAIDARPEERAALLLHAIGDRQVALFTALLATCLNTDFAAARDLVIGHDGMLWVALRAIALDRATIAGIGIALARDVEAFAGQLDAIVAIDPAAARQVLARLLLPPDFRAAVARIEGGR